MEKSIDPGTDNAVNINNLAEYIRTTCDYREHDPGTLSPLTLAYIGDTVFDLVIRTRVVTRGQAPVNRLHKASSRIVNATTQSAMIHELLPKLTEEELSIYKRGRNAKSHSTAKNASVNDYKAATGFEALLGWLYLKGDFGRITELVLPVIPEYE